MPKIKVILTQELIDLLPELQTEVVDAGIAVGSEVVFDVYSFIPAAEEASAEESVVATVDEVAATDGSADADDPYVGGTPGKGRG